MQKRLIEPVDENFNAPDTKARAGTIVKK